MPGTSSPGSRRRRAAGAQALTSRRLTWPPPPIRSARRLVRAWILVALVVACAVACALLQLFAVRPFLPPAGHGATLAGEATVMEGVAARLPMARPPVPGALSGHVTVRDAPAGSPAAAAGLRPGDVVLHARNLLTGHAVDLSSPPEDPDDAMRRWREAYRLGTRGPLDVRVRRADGTTGLAARRTPPVWALPWTTWLGAVAVHLGPIVEMLSIVGAAVVLLLLRPRDATALLIVDDAGVGRHLHWRVAARGRVGAAAASGCAADGLLVAGDAGGLSPDRHRDPYFPSKSGLLVRRPWLHAVPVVVALPMVVPARAPRCFWPAPTAWRAGRLGRVASRASSTRRLPAGCC